MNPLALIILGKGLLGIYIAYKAGQLTGAKRAQDEMKQRNKDHD